MTSLHNYFSYYEFPTGRRLFAMREVAARAAALKLTKIQQLAEAAVEQALQTASLESRWRRARSTAVGKRLRAQAIDVQIDRTLGGLANQLGATVHAFGSQGIGETAGKLLARLFPEGAAAITSMTYENELAASEALLTDLRAQAEAVAALSLAPFVQRLTQLTSEFRGALREETSREVGHDQLRAARVQGQEQMLRVVASILGDFGGPDPEDIARRQQLLAPLDSQQRRMRERFSTRRGAGDVSPETGEELEPDIESPADVAGSGASPTSS